MITYVQIDNSRTDEYLRRLGHPGIRTERQSNSDIWKDFNWDSDNQEFSDENDEGFPFDDGAGAASATRLMITFDEKGDVTNAADLPDSQEVDLFFGGGKKNQSEAPALAGLAGASAADGSGANRQSWDLNSVLDYLVGLGKVLSGFHLLAIRRCTKRPLICDNFLFIYHNRRRNLAAISTRNWITT